MTAKEFTRKFAAYAVLVIGIVIVLAFLVAGIGSFIAFPDAFATKKLLLGVGFIFAAIICAVIAYVVFDVLREEGEDAEDNESSWSKEEVKKS